MQHNLQCFEKQKATYQSPPHDILINTLLLSSHGNTPMVWPPVPRDYVFTREQETVRYHVRKHVENLEWSNMKVPQKQEETDSEDINRSFDGSV